MRKRPCYLLTWPCAPCSPWPLPSCAGRSEHGTGRASWLAHRRHLATGGLRLAPRAGPHHGQAPAHDAPKGHQKVPASRPGRLCPGVDGLDLVRWQREVTHEGRWSLLANVRHGPAKFTHWGCRNREELWKTDVHYDHRWAGMTATATRESSQSRDLLLQRPRTALVGCRRTTHRHSAVGNPDVQRTVRAERGPGPPQHLPDKGAISERLKALAFSRPLLRGAI